MPKLPIDRVLVLDDHDDVRAMLCALVTYSGYACRAVSSRDEALALLPSWMPSLIIFEPGLKDGTGRGASHRFRDWARAANCSLRIIIYTYARSPDLAIRDDVDDCLLKPSEAAVIRAALDHGLRAQLRHM